MSYMKSIYLQKDKSIFKLEELPADKFAESLGLPGAPKIKFLNKEVASKKKNAPLTLPQLSDTSDDEDGGDGSSEEEDTNNKIPNAVRHIS